MSDHEEWMAQAKRDLDVARHLRSGAFYEWASYAAQQAAEKALKALRTAQGVKIEGPMKSHEITTLLDPIGKLAPSPDPRLAQAGQLTVHNQDARYPSLRGGSGFSAPADAYDDATAENAIDLAEAVVAYADPLMRDLDQFWASRQSAPASGSGGTPSGGGPPASPP
jgi:HEPN domain-containing protein